jgi:hypothetical protein
MRQRKLEDAKAALLEEMKGESERVRVIPQ